MFSSRENIGTGVVLVLGILGSPRKGGNSDLLLDAALDGARAAGAEVRKVDLGALTFSGCRECGGCAAGQDCVLTDDLTAMYRLLERADVVILASPIFFEGLTAQAKALIDRCQVYWVRKYALKRPSEKRRVGGLIAVAARLRTDFSPAVAVVKAFFLTINAAYGGELLMPGFEEKGSVLDSPGALQEARDLGRSLVERFMGAKGQ